MYARKMLSVTMTGLVLGGLVAFESQAAGLLVADGGFGGVLEIKEHDVKVVINNGVAVTDVNQVFVNTEDRVVEALYTFPVPKGASVSNFSMWINGKEMIGEVVEKKRAREIYESYKQTRRDPGLLEQVDYKTFEMRIFPIPAGAEQRVKVTYYQELDFDNDWATYVYPLATVTRRGVDQRTKGRFALSLKVKSEIPIVDLSSSSHGDDFIVVKHSEEYYQASLENSGGDLSRDVVLAFNTERPRTGIDIVTSKEPSEDGHFMMTITAGQELEELSQGMDYVFVLDISGSMANDQKLKLSRGSLFAFTDSLGGEDRVEIMTFNVATQALFGDLEQVTEQRKVEVKEFLNLQRARGGTTLRPTVSAAYRYQDSDRILNVVILSDGMTEQREQRELIQLMQERPSGCRVFCIGVGNEVNRPLLQQIADDAGGLAAFISEEDSFKRQAQAFRRKLMRPAIRDLAVSVQGADIYGIEPLELPDLFHGSPVRLYGKYRSGGDIEITVKGDVQGAPIEQRISALLPESNSENPEIERMWAWHRVEGLLENERETGIGEKHKAEIVSLCEEYSIVSQYASFIVLENDGEYKRWKIDRRNEKRIDRDRAAQQDIRARLQQIRQEQNAKLGPQRSSKNSTHTVAANSPQSQRAPSNGGDISLSPSRNRDGGGGGGAIDPFTGLIILGLGGAAAVSRRSKKSL